jgi:hypothetical protein
VSCKCACAIRARVVCIVGRIARVSHCRRLLAPVVAPVPLTLTIHRRICVAWRIPRRVCVWSCSWLTRVRATLPGRWVRLVISLSNCIGSCRSVRCTITITITRIHSGVRVSCRISRDADRGCIRGRVWSSTDKQRRRRNRHKEACEAGIERALLQFDNQRLSLKESSRMIDAIAADKDCAMRLDCAMRPSKEHTAASLNKPYGLCIVFM